MKIIAATDFSPPALDAARSAARLARKLGDTLLLVKVFEPPLTLYPEMALANTENVDSALRTVNQNDLAKLKSLLEEEGIAVEHRLLVGVPDQMIASCAKEEQARLIVMGTHGRGASARVLLGSVAERTVLAAPCPVLVMRVGAAPFDEWVKGTRPLRVLVGIDRGPATAAALSWIRELKKAGSCHLTLVHEYWPPAEYTRLGLRTPRELLDTDPEVVGILERELRASLEDLGKEGEATLRIQAAWGRVGDFLALEAEAERADLLVVGTHQPHGWDRVKTGSSAISTLRASRVPVLAVPVKLDATTKASAEEIPAIRSVVAATDLSDIGNGAVPHAYSLLRGAGGVVDLCHVYERPVPSPAYVYDIKNQALSPEHRAELDGRLRALIPPDAERVGITTRIHVVDGGAPAETILQASRRLGADAIVIGSHGRGGVARTVLGSVAESVMRGSEAPVYVVRHRVK